MFGVLAVLAGFWSPASAQLPPGLTLPTGTPGLGIPSANTRYLVADVVSKRFPGEDVVGPAFKTGEQVDVILEDGATVRIRQGERYGWVPADQLTAMAPASSAPAGMLPPGANPLLGGLKPLAPAPAALSPKTP